MVNEGSYNRNNFMMNFGWIVKSFLDDDVLNTVRSGLWGEVPYDSLGVYFSGTLFVLASSTWIIRISVLFLNES